MTATQSRSKMIARRGEVMAELFLEEEGPRFLSRPTSPDVGYDLLVGFLNDAGGINTFAVEVRADEQPPPASGVRLPLPRFDRLAKSNIPGLLLVVDVKANTLYSAWLAPELASDRTAAVHVPVRLLDAAATADLKRRFTAAPIPAARGTAPVKQRPARPGRGRAVATR